MIDKRIKILSDYLKEQNNVPWRVIDAFNNIVEHTVFLENNYQEKTKYLERLASWYVDHMIN